MAAVVSPTSALPGSTAAVRYIWNGQAGRGRETVHWCRKITPIVSHRGVIVVFLRPNEDERKGEKRYRCKEKWSAEIYEKD